MYNPTRSHQGSVLIVALIIVVLLSIMTTTFLEKVLNLGKTSGGIHNSAQAYSLATGLIEEQLMDPAMTKAAPWNISVYSGSSAYTGRSLTAATGAFIMPEQWVWWLPWKWNSTFDSNWNIIGIGEPIQIVIPEGINWSAVNFYFRVPNIPGETTSTGNASNSGIILWTFGYSGASLYASGETHIFKFIDIDGNSKSINSYSGNTSSGSSATFWFFYGDSTIGVGPSGNKCTWYQCTLKLSMIRPFIALISSRSYSFLEYKIDFVDKTVPSQYMVIDASAYMYGYLRSRQIRIPQITTSTATDFTVLQ